ncbi:MAG: helix-turn-helix transcriptional regulator [Halioglobus sp.]
MIEKRYSGVADYLATQRELKALSQETLAEQLVEHSACFEGVDGLAISRWERGTVSPSIERQIALMEFFGDEPHLLLGSADYELKQLPSLSAFHKWMRQNLLYNHVMGGHPYANNDDMEFDKCSIDHPLSSRWLNLSCRYNQNLTRGREAWSEQHLWQLASRPSSHCVFYHADDQLLGHAILLRVSDEILNDLLTGRMNDTELRPDQLLEDDAPGNLYCQSIYFGTRSICEDGLTHIFRTLIENRASRALGSKARANFGVQLMDLLMGEVIDRGDLITGHRDGARYQGKYLEHVSYLLKREKLLSNPTLLNLVRQL